VKFKASQVDPFIARPRADVATVLIYGPDSGLVSERARKLALKIVPALDDPFQVSELDPLQLEREPALLVEEAQALCLMGGRRLVRVRNADDRAAAACRQLLALDDQAGFVLLEAGELAAGSKLRRLVEAAPKAAAALPCYRPDERTLPAQVRETANELGLLIEAEALDYLASHLGGDRLVTRRELEKLALYMYERDGRPVALADAAAVIGDSGAVETDEVVRAALLGEQARLDRGLDRLMAEGAHPTSLLRACTRTLLQAVKLKGEVASGKPLASALAGVHFKSQDLMQTLVRDWAPDRLVGALARLQDAELRSRRAHAAEPLVCREALAGLAES
jgi:DNA polymerase-3 subunit delta